MTVVGSATVEVSPAVAGFGAKTEAAVRAALAGIQAQIELELDENGLREKITAAVAAAGAGQNIDIEANVDTDSFESKLRRAAQVVDSIDLDVDIDDDGAQGELRRLVKTLEATNEIHLRASVEGGGGGGGATAGQVGDAVGGIFGRAVLRSAARILAAGGLAQIFTAAVAGATALGGALIAASSAAGSLVGTVAALPGILSAAAQAAGSIALALGGVGGALKAYTAAQKAIGSEIAGGGGGGGQSGASARAAEKAIRNATRGIEDAVRSAAESIEAANERLADATRNVGDSQEELAETYERTARRIEDAERAVADSARDTERSREDLARTYEETSRRIAAAEENVVDAAHDVERAREDLAQTYEDTARRQEDAERDLARAQRNQQDAVESLTRAREQAREEVDDLRRSVARLSLTEDEARRRLAEAQTRNALERKRAEQDLSGVTESTLRALERQAALEDKAAENPREKAANDLRDAELDLQEAQAKRAETVAKLDTADRDGIEGSERVITARERLADATQSAADSERRLVDTQRQGARSIEDANNRVTASLEKQADAQQALADAQRDGARRIVDAQEKVTDSMRDQVDAQRDLVDAQKEGARDIADAQRAVSDAIREQSQAQRDLVRAQEDGARRIADAQEALADAIASAAEAAESGASGAAGAINRYQAALDALNPYTRRFVEFLVSLVPRLKEIQTIAARGLLPGLEQAITTVLPILTDLEPIIEGTALALAHLAINAANLVSSPAWRADLVLLGRRNITVIETLGRASLSVADLLRNVTIAAGPLTQHIADLVEHFASLAAEAAQVGRDNGKLEAYFTRVGERLDKVVLSAQFLGRALLTIFRDATPAGDRYLDSLVRLSARFDLIVQKASESGALRDFFESTRPAVEAIAGLLGDLAVGLVNIGKANLGGFTGFITQLRNELLPTLLGVVSTLDTGFLSALVTMTTRMAELFGAFLSFNPTLTLFVTLLGGMAEGIAHLLTDIPILSPIIQGLVTALGALAVITAVGNLLRLAESSLFAGKAIQALTGTTDAAAAAQTRFGAALGLVGKAFGIAALIFGAKAAVDAFLPSMEKVAGAVASSKTPLADFEAQLARINKPSLLDQLLIGIKHPVDGAKILLDQLTLNFDRAGKDIDAVMKKVGLSGEEGFRKLAQASEAAAIRVIADMKSQGRDTAAYERILESLIQEKARQGIAEEAVTKRVQDATSALKGNNAELERHTQRMRDATSQALSLSGAEISTEEAVDRLTDAVTKNTATFDTDTEAGRENKRALDDLVRSIQVEIGELGKAAQAGALDNERKQQLLNHLDLLARSGYPGAEQAAANLRGQLESIQNTYTAVIDLNTERAQEKLNALQRQLNAISAQTVEGEEAGARTAAGVQREFGGRVLRNQAYIVGERRAELFIPDKDGVILPQVPDLSTPKGLSQTIGDINLFPAESDFDTGRLIDTLRDLDESLTSRLSAMEDLQVEKDRAGAAQQVSEARATVEQTFNGALVQIDATFGPGSSAADIIKAMEQIADQRLATALAQVLRDHGAGAGTRGTP